MTRLKRIALLSAISLMGIGAVYSLAGSQPKITNGTVLPVRTTILGRFDPDSEIKIFGKLEFIGGLVMQSDNGEMGAMSAIRFLPDGEHFITVMDTGYWAKGKIIRAKTGRLQAISDFSIHEMAGPAGFQKDRKGFMDAEGLVLAGNGLLVGFENRDRIDHYPLDRFESSSPMASQRPNLAEGQTLESNGGMEALLRAPDDGPLQGSLIFVTEKTYDDAGNFIAGIQSGPKAGSFAIKRDPPYNITDGVFLPDGSFLLLERRLGLTSGIGVRIRRFQSGTINGKGETLDGETIFEADFSQEIDNMEGIDILKGPEGDLRVILISDNNHSILERNLMLEFRLLP